MEAQNKSLVSIITPCFNGAAFLPRYFRSIMAQTYAPLEVVLVDDGSTDDTPKIVEQYRDQLCKRGISLYYIRKANGGQASAIKLGLKHIHGQYITWPDCDDWMTPECIANKVSFLESNPQIHFVYSQIAFIQENDLKRVAAVSHCPTGKEGNIFYGLLYHLLPFAPVAYLARTSALLAAIPSDGISESRVGQNYQLLLPLALSSDCGFLHQVLGYYLIRSSSHSHAKKDLKKKSEDVLAEYALVKEVLAPFPEANRKYSKDVEVEFLRRRFFIFAEMKDYKSAKDIYLEIKQRKGPSKKLRLRLAAIRNPFMNFFRISVFCIKRFWAHIDTRIFGRRRFRDISVFYPTE